MKVAGCILLIAALSLACFTSATGATDAPFFFVQLADTQLGFTNGNKDMAVEVANFTQAVEHINRLKPAFVLISGDLVNKPHDIAQTRAFWRVARELDPSIPLRLVAGNHDVGAATAADVTSYRRLFGEDHYSFSHSGSEFIVLNSGLFSRNADAALRDEQRKWFETKLAAARTRNATHVFVCSHHPWFLETADEPDRYENVPLAYRRGYLDLMKLYKVEYALAGHLHYDLLANDGDLTVVAVGPISRSFAKPPVVGFRIWRVYKDRIDTQFYPLDRVPASIDLR